MNCRTVRKRLALHAGGDLRAARARRVERHLRGCAACRRELKAKGFSSSTNHAGCSRHGRWHLQRQHRMQPRERLPEKGPDGILFLRHAALSTL